MRDEVMRARKEGNEDLSDKLYRDYVAEYNRQDAGSRGEEMLPMWSPTLEDRPGTGKDKPKSLEKVTMAQQPVAPAVVAPVPPVSEDPETTEETETTEDPKEPKSPIAKFLASLRKRKNEKNEKKKNVKGESEDEPADTGPSHSDVPGVKGVGGALGRGKNMDSVAEMNKKLAKNNEKPDEDEDED